MVSWILWNFGPSGIAVSGRRCRCLWATMDEELVITKSLNCDPLHLIKCPGGYAMPLGMLSMTYMQELAYISTAHCALCLGARG